MSTWMTAVFAAILGSSGLFTFIQFIFARHDKKKESLARIEAALCSTNSKIDSINGKLDATSDVALSTARDRLNYLSNLYIERGYIYSNEYDSFIELGKTYLEAGGNGVIKEKFHRCENLPIKRVKNDN